MKTALRKRWPRARYWINAAVLAAPVWFFYDALTPEFPPAWQTQSVGPFTVTPTPHDEAEPYPHDGVHVKDFAFHFCDDCAGRIRMAYANAGPAPVDVLDGEDGVVHGRGSMQEAHVPYPPRPGPTDRLWLTVQEWNGTLHRVAWPLPGVSAAPD